VLAGVTFKVDRGGEQKIKKNAKANKEMGEVPQKQLPGVHLRGVASRCTAPTDAREREK